MTPEARELLTGFRFKVLTLAPIVLLAGFLLFAPPDGNERAHLMQFFGRFHPISVHLPIALLILVPLMELAGRTRYFPNLSSAVPFVLGVATLGAIGATALGWSLARSGGYSGSLITQHMWAGVLVSAAAWACWMLRLQASPAGTNRLYTAGLIVAVAAVSFTGYRGGQISQGENHLTEFLPPPFDSWLGVADPFGPENPAYGPSTFYGARIQPIFTQHCASCHGRNRHSSDLRLHRFEGVMRGGKHGVVVKPGDPKASELIRRITLPSSSDDAMPPSNRPPLSPSDISLIEQWVAAGASGTQPVADFKPAAAPVRAAAAQVSIQEIDPAAVAEQRKDLAATVAQLQHQLPNVFDYESRGSANLVVNAAWMGAKFGDREFETLAPLAPRIVNADFSNTSITDRSAKTLAMMRSLRTLKLMNTKITDTTVQTLGGLTELEVLNVFHTSVSPVGLSALKTLPKLRSIYTGETRISTASAVPAELRGKVVF